MWMNYFGHFDVMRLHTIWFAICCFAACTRFSTITLLCVTFAIDTTRHTSNYNKSDNYVGASAHCFQWQTSHKYAHFNEGLFWLNFEEHQNMKNNIQIQFRWQLTKITSFDEIPSRDSSSYWLDDACINIVTQSAFYLQAKFKLTSIQAPMNHRLILWWIWFFLTKESINFLCGNCLTF